ncbi:hypothetical protein SOVF_119090 [Spinacia oleracea]|nr:hypothetical protein SOVF_119090 [Spinacia oleracea]
MSHTISCHWVMMVFTNLSCNSLIEIKVAVAAIRNIRGLPFMEEFKKRKPLRAPFDIFDWLGCLWVSDRKCCQPEGD